MVRLTQGEGRDFLRTIETPRAGGRMPSLFLGRAMLAGLGIILVGLFGLLAGSYGLGALLLPAAAIIALVLLLWPLVGLMIIAAVLPVQNLFVTESGGTAMKLLGVVVVVAWVTQKLLRRQSFKPLFASSFTLVGGIFVVLALASTLWARVPEAAIGGTKQLLQLFVWGLLIVDVAASWEKVDWFVKALVIGGAAAALLTVEQFYLGGFRRAGEEIAGGVNATAIVLLTLVPFGFYLIRTQENMLWRILGLGYTGAAVVAIAITFSRMNMLLLPPLLVALYWQTLRGRRARGWLLGLSAVGLALSIFVVPWDRVERRAATIVPYLGATIGDQGSYPDQSSSGRGYHLRVGVAIAQDYPLLGAGYRNYGYLFRDEYQFKVPGSAYIYESVRSPHSSYVGILADLGLVGLSVWLLLLFGVGIRNVVRAWRLTRDRPASLPHVLVQALACSLSLHVLAYALYTPNDQNMLFWAWLAMSAVVTRLASATRSAPSWETSDAYLPDDASV